MDIGHGYQGNENDWFQGDEKVSDSIVDVLEELHPAGCGFQHRCPTDLHGPLGIPTSALD